MTLLADTDPLLRHLRGLEEALLRPGVRKSSQPVTLLAEQFVEFGSSGRIYTKGDLVALLQDEMPAVQTASNFRAYQLSPQAVLLTYLIRRDAEPPVYTLRSSVWQLRGEAWQMVFHQGTPTSPPANAA